MRQLYNDTACMTIKTLTKKRQNDQILAQMNKIPFKKSKRRLQPPTWLWLPMNLF